MDQKKVLLVFGGESSEHSVSLMSSKNVYAAIDKTKFAVNLCYIDESGSWWLVDGIDENSINSTKKMLLPKLGQSKFVIQPSCEDLAIDVILPILHGVNGEDGTVQGLAQLLHIPVVGCGMTASAIAMDKVVAKQVLEQSGIKTTPYIVHTIHDGSLAFADLSAKFGGELFVKPANGGSSVGVSRVGDQSELDKALELAFRYCPKVLIEKAINARELETAALEFDDGTRISMVGEIKADREFYDFDSKYDEKSSSVVQIPADISAEMMEQIRSIAARAFTAIDGSGMARIDFFLADDGVIYLNEINTIPGFTNISMYPKLWQNMGLSYSDLITQLINIAK